MFKKIIKEILIMALLLLAIILIFSYIFYGYAPIDKLVPAKIAYETPEEIKTELNGENQVSLEPINVTFTVEESEIEGYKKTNTYNAGKINPFEEYKEEVNTNENLSNGTSTNNNSQSNVSKGNLFDSGSSK